MATKVLSGLAMLVVAGSANAQHDSNVSIVLHSAPPSFSGCAGFTDAELSCSSVLTDADFSFGPTFIYFLIAKVPDWQSGGGGEMGGVGAAQFGVMYDATVQAGEWSLCTGGAQIPQDDFEGVWPASNSGNAVTWPGGCLDAFANADNMSRIGFISVNGGSGVLKAIGDPRLGDDDAPNRAQFTDCGPTLFRICPQQLGEMNIMGTTGFNPCEETCAVPTRETTWSEIKSQF